MSNQPAFKIRADIAPFVHWSRRGSCGEPGCSDPECCCALCGLPIGISEDDPRCQGHDEEYCCDPNCVICVDSVPLTLWRGEGDATEQAQFHDACFRKMMDWKATP